MTLDKYS